MKNTVDHNALVGKLIEIISETNGVTLNNTLELLSFSPDSKTSNTIDDFKEELISYQNRKTDVHSLLKHPVGKAFFTLFKGFPLRFHDQHIHLTGSLSAEFIYPRLRKILDGKKSKNIEQKIVSIYGADALPIDSVEKVDDLIRLKDGDHFNRYLDILFLAKLILRQRSDYRDAAYHLADELYSKYNMGFIRLKFTLSRLTKIKKEQIPGTENVRPDDVILGIHEGLSNFKAKHPDFSFLLSPCFRKESDFFDSTNYQNKQEHFNAQVEAILKLIKEHPYLSEHLCEVDTVGNEKELYNKRHFEQMRSGLRKLQYYGFKIKSHHGETWQNLKKGIQAVDNSLNIWHINTLEHGLSLGINPNYYLHRLYQKVIDKNLKSEAYSEDTPEFHEINNLEWYDCPTVKDKIMTGIPLSEEETITFLKVKFHTAREVEHYQHDVLNQMINKGTGLTALPSSNAKLTNCFPDFKSHPFSWWEKKGVNLGIGTDNYITLSTNIIKEMLILLFSDPDDLKVMKLLMVATKENRRPYMSHLLWEMRKHFSKS